MDNGTQRVGFPCAGRPPNIEQATASRLAYYPLLLRVKGFPQRKDDIGNIGLGNSLSAVGQHAFSASSVETELAALNFEQLIPQTLDKERVIHDEPSEGYLFTKVLDESNGEDGVANGNHRPIDFLSSNNDLHRGIVSKVRLL